MTDDLMIPAPTSLETRVHGVPEGCWYNFVQWSDDSKHISFTMRSAGEQLLSCSMTCVTSLSQQTAFALASAFTQAALLHSTLPQLLTTAVALHFECYEAKPK